MLALLPILLTSQLLHPAKVLIHWICIFLEESGKIFSLVFHLMRTHRRKQQGGRGM